MDGGSLATDFLTDLTDGRGLFGNGFFDGFNGWMGVETRIFVIMVSTFCFLSQDEG